MGSENANFQSDPRACSPGKVYASLIALDCSSHVFVVLKENVQ